MKKVTFSIFIIAAFLLFIFDVKALGCNLEQRVKYREIASKVKVSYEESNIEKVDSDGEKYSVSVLDLKIYNVSEELSYKLTTDNKTADLDYTMAYDGVITVRISDVSTIKNYALDIYPTTYDCYTENVRSIKITLPKYNYESSSEICDGIKDYYLCQNYILNDLNEDTFYENVQNYRKKMKIQKEEGIELETSDEGIISKTFKYKYYVVGILICLGVLLTFIVLKKKGSVEK